VRAVPITPEPASPATARRSRACPTMPLVR
jgi:hypothetical protein